MHPLWATSWKVPRYNAVFGYFPRGSVPGKGKWPFSSHPHPYARFGCSQGIVSRPHAVLLPLTTTVYCRSVGPKEVLRQCKGWKESEPFIRHALAFRPLIASGQFVSQPSRQSRVCIIPGLAGRPR